MGHISAPYVNKLPHVALNVDDLICAMNINNCRICAKAKMTRKSFDKDRDRATRPGQIVHADLIGPITPVTFNTMKRYLLTILDDYTRYLQVFVLKTKDETPECVNLALREIQAKYPGKGQLDIFRCDRGSEFTSKECEAVLTKYSMNYQLSELNAHEHGGACERVNLTIQQRIRSLLLDAGFPCVLWGQVAAAACWLYNRTPHSAVDFITPYEMLFAQKPDLSQIKMFGASCEVLDEKIPKSAKARSRSETHFLIGYTQTGYRVYHPRTKLTTDCCHIRIFENEQYKDVYPDQYIDDNLVFEPDENTIPATVPTPGVLTRNKKQKLEESSALPCKNLTLSNNHVSLHICSEQCEHDSPSLDEIVPESIQSNDTLENPDQVSVNSSYLNGYETLSSLDSNVTYDKNLIAWTNVPLTYAEATSTTYSPVWDPPIQKEKLALKKHCVWKIVPRPKDTPIVPVKWIFTCKADGTAKARLVVVGVSDPETYTKDETASPTPNPGAFSWLITHAVQLDWSMTQIDICNAYLHADIDREKYVSAPPGFNVNPKTHACQLNKALYGLPTSPLCWYEKVKNTFESLEFSSSPREPCIYVKRNKRDPSLIIVILVYVDDFLVTGSDLEGISHVLDDLEKTFDLKNLGFPERFLGIEIKRTTAGSIFIHQAQYISNMLSILEMQECEPEPTPMVPIANHRVSPSERRTITAPYKSAIGYIQYLAACTRPDISFAVGYVARFQANPLPLHWKLVKRILKYLKNTSNYGIFYGKKSPTQLDAYADADYAAELQRRSTTGYLVRMYGCPIMWCSRLQRTISESTAEAELKALCEAAHDIRFLLYLTEELLYPISRPVTLYEDNVGALRHCQLYASRGRIKHLELCYFKAQEYVRNRLLRIQKVSSNDQLADILTKPLLEQQFENLSSHLVQALP